MACAPTSSSPTSRTGCGSRPRSLLPELPEAARFDTDVFAWRILAAFEDTAWYSRQPRLAAWLGSADAVMRHELARRVAGLFEQYLVYRPEWLEAWFRDETIALPGGADAAPDQAWQAALWRRLAHETASDGRHPILALLALLDARGISLAGGDRLPASAHVFCLPTMPPVHLELLQRLGRHVELHVYALNPCQEYWFDVVDARRLAWLGAQGELLFHEQGNRLLAAWGRQTQSALSLLVDAAAEGAIEDAAFTRAGRRSVLGALQDAILDLAELDPGSLADVAHDRSIEVHVCHSLTRELEVLHDRLLGLVAGADAPQPGDILVVTPDLDAAAPLIDAVFGTAPRERHLPYAISGRARSQVNAPARALLELLALVASRLPVNAVFGLLQQPVVARRFGLAEDDLDQVRDWLVDAGIRWALDAEHRGSFDVPAHARHSFADGLDRLFLGYALPSHRPRPFQGRLPAGDAEGSGAFVLGAFWRFVDALKALRERVAAPRAPADWPAILGDALRDFVAPADADLEDLREVDEDIAELGEQWRRSGLAAPLPLDVVRAALDQALADPARGGVPTGSITFASMSSLRNVPYRVVCAIGLDDGAFPDPAAARRVRPDDLAPRPGDRQRRFDERNVFLDLLLAARDRVHLSYAGRSVRDNSVRPPRCWWPSCWTRSCPRSRTRPRTPRHARPRGARWSSSIRCSRSRCRPSRSAATRGCAATRATRRGAAPEPVRRRRRRRTSRPTADEGEGDDDAATPRGGPSFIARRCRRSTPLGATSRSRGSRTSYQPVPVPGEAAAGPGAARDDQALEDDEPFLPDWAAVRRWCTAAAGAAGRRRRGRATLALAGTALPAGASAAFLERELKACATLPTRCGALRAARAGAARGRPGRPDRRAALAAARRVRRPAPARPAAPSLRQAHAGGLPGRLAAAPAALPRTPAGVLPVTTGIARDGRFFFTEADAPAATLETLLRLYAKGLREPLAFFPRSAWAWLEGDRDGPAKAIARFRPDAFNDFAEGQDAGYPPRAARPPDPFAPELVRDFYDIAQTVFGPLRDCLAFDE